MYVRGGAPFRIFSENPLPFSVSNEGLSSNSNWNDSWGEVKPVILMRSTMAHRMESLLNPEAWNGFLPSFPNPQLRISLS